MSFESSNIKVVRTARYWLGGDRSGKATTLIMVLHGYGMSALECIEKFDALGGHHILLTAPEGLSRFYRKGFAGEVAASWMTKEEREHEIEDQSGYLDKLLNHLMKEEAPLISKVIVLGYSQGVATGSRWIGRRNGRDIHTFVSYAGEIAPDVLSAGWPEGVQVIQVYSETDEFIPSSKFHEQAAILETSGVKLFRLQYSGKHEVNAETVSQLNSLIV